MSYTIPKATAERIALLATLDADLDRNEAEARKLESQAQEFRQNAKRIMRNIAEVKFGLKPGAIVVIRDKRRLPSSSYHAPRVWKDTITEAVIETVGTDCGLSVAGKGTLYVRKKLADGTFSKHETKLYSWDNWELKP